MSEENDDWSMVGATYDNFFELPFSVQCAFIKQFRLILDSAVDCVNHVKVFGDTMTHEQFETISDIVKKFEDKNNG